MKVSNTFLIFRIKVTFLLNFDRSHDIFLVNVAFNLLNSKQITHLLAIVSSL